jgi:hypothetical protein
MDVTVNQNVMVGCDEAEVNDGHYAGDRKVGARSPNDSPDPQPVFPGERWNDTVQAQVLD